MTDCTKCKYFDYCSEIDHTDYYGNCGYYLTV
jgi:hypothetical protein